MIDLMGRVFMSGTNDPFHAANDLLEKIKAKVIVVDFHAGRATERKWRGLASRRHTQLGAGHAYPHPHRRRKGITRRHRLPNRASVMSGPYDSVIGVEKDLVLYRFLTGMPGKFEAAKGNPKMCATLVTCDPSTGRASAVERIMLGAITQVRESCINAPLGDHQFAKQAAEVRVTPGWATTLPRYSTCGRVGRCRVGGATTVTSAAQCRARHVLRPLRCLDWFSS